MSELAPLIEDLALILVLAGIVTIFCKKFNQPLVLGYILAGFFASPHFNLLPNVVDTANITVWSDIGVIFILFSLGLDFNFARIKSIGGTALLQNWQASHCLVMAVPGCLAGSLLTVYLPELCLPCLL